MQAGKCPRRRVNGLRAVRHHCKGLIAELPHNNSHSQISSASHGKVSLLSEVERFNLPHRSVKLGEARHAYRTGSGSYTSNLSPRLGYQNNHAVGYIILREPEQNDEQEDHLVQVSCRSLSISAHRAQYQSRPHLTTHNGVPN